MAVMLNASVMRATASSSKPFTLALPALVVTPAKLSSMPSPLVSIATEPGSARPCNRWRTRRCWSVRGAAAKRTSIPVHRW